jgi:Domain of unknown function (DUF4266)
VRSASSSKFSFKIPWILVIGLVLVGAGGCGHIGVKAHQRELLADRIMKLDGDAQERAADDHVLSNREGAIGGTGTAGGGCGCN